MNKKIYNAQKKTEYLISKGTIQAKKDGDIVYLTYLWNRILPHYSVEGKSFEQCITILFSEYVEKLGYNPIYREEQSREEMRREVQRRDNKDRKPHHKK